MAKKVYVKDLFVEMEVKNKGVEFEVRDNDKQLGDVILKKQVLSGVRAELRQVRA